MPYAIVDARGHPHARPFYLNVAREPIGPSDHIQVTDILGLTNLTALGLLKQMLKVPESQRSKLVIVGHGNPTGLDLRIAGGSVRFQTNALDVFKENEFGRITDTDASKRLGISEALLKEYRALQQRVRKRPFGRLEFRACNVGNVETLRAYKHFFGATIVGGPSVPDAYILIARASAYRKPDYDRFAADNQSAIIETSPAGHVAYVVEKRGLTRWRMDFCAESDAAAVAWYKTCYLGSPVPRVRSMYMHAQLPASTPIFPARNGYRANLVQVA